MFRILHHWLLFSPNPAFHLCNSIPKHTPKFRLFQNNTPGLDEGFSLTIQRTVHFCYRNQQGKFYFSSSFHAYFFCKITKKTIAASE